MMETNCIDIVYLILLRNAIILISSFLTSKIFCLVIGTVHRKKEGMLLLSEIPSGMCAKLHTMAASNNRDHPSRSLSLSLLASTINCSPDSQALLEVTHQDHSVIACSCHIHVFLLFAHIPFMVNHTINATPPERL